MSGGALPPHPGRSSAEERHLDLIYATGLPRGPKRVLDKLIADGLVVVGSKLCRDTFGIYEVPTYTLPTEIRDAVEAYLCAYAVQRGIA